MHGSRRVFSLEQRTSHLLGVVPAPGHEETVEQCQAGRGIYRISLHSLMQACQFCVVHAFPFTNSHVLFRLSSQP
jgi:hypothetical protein